MKQSYQAKEIGPGRIQLLGGVRSTGDGLHIEDSILWLDATNSGKLSFLSSAKTKVQPQGPQIIATEETIRLIQTSQSVVNALICQYNRPFSIGKLKIELLPSGSTLGGASLFLQWEDKRLLYAPELQTQKIPTVRKMQLKKAHVLILSAKHPDPHFHFPNRKKEKERFLKVVKNYMTQGQYPFVFCEPSGKAQELIKWLTENDVPVATHQTIYRYNKIYESYGNDLGRYSQYNPKYQKHKVTFFPISERGRWHYLKRPISDRPIIYIEDHFEQTPGITAMSEVDDRFYLSSTCEGRDYKEIIQAVAPKEVYIFGPYAKKYVDEFKNLAQIVQPLYDNSQPTLF
jgi:hypothetical protein